MALPDSPQPFHAVPPAPCPSPKGKKSTTSNIEDVVEREIANVPTSSPRWLSKANVFLVNRKVFHDGAKLVATLTT